MSDDTSRLEELEAENEKLKKDLAKQKRLATRSLAGYQQRALQMELIRQQNEDLDRLAADLAKAKRVAEERAREVIHAELEEQALSDLDELRALVRAARELPLQHSAGLLRAAGTRERHWAGSPVRSNRFA